MRRTFSILALVALAGSAGCESAPPLTLPPAPWRESEPQHIEPTTTAPELGPPEWQRIGSSVRGKPIEAATIGSGPRRIYVIGGIQGDEPEGPLVADRLPESLAEVTNIQSATIRIVRDMNPDGTAARTRGNTRGTDLNRNWPSRDFQKDARVNRRPKSELETTVVYEDMRKFNPDVVIVFHSSARGPQVTFEGPALQTARAFTSAARQQEPKWRLIPETRYQTPGSLESLVGRDWKKAAIVVEFPRRTNVDSTVRAVRDGVIAVAQGPAKPAAPSTPSKPATAAEKPVARTGPALGSPAR